MENIQSIANIEKIADTLKNNSEDGFFFVPWIGKNYDQGLNGSKVLVVGASHYCNHSNVCTHPKSNNECSNFYDNKKCILGCEYFQECTIGKTKDYNDKCAWMKKKEYNKSYENLCNAICNNSKCNSIFEKLNSTTLGEICNFLDTEWEDNKSFKTFSKFCKEYFLLDNDKEYRNKLWSRIAFINYSQNFQPKSTGNSFQEGDLKSFKKYLELLTPNVVIVWGCALGEELEKQRFKKEATFNGYNWTNEGIQFVNSYHPSYSGFKDNGSLEEALDKAFQEVSKVTNG